MAKVETGEVAIEIAVAMAAVTVADMRHVPDLGHDAEAAGAGAGVILKASSAVFKLSKFTSVARIPQVLRGW